MGDWSGQQRFNLAVFAETHATFVCRVDHLTQSEILLLAILDALEVLRTGWVVLHYLLLFNYRGGHVKDSFNFAALSLASIPHVQWHII